VHKRVLVGRDHGGLVRHWVDLGVRHKAFPKERRKGLILCSRGVGL